MNLEHFNSTIEMLISTQGALLGETLPNLRAVRIGFKNNDVNLYCFFDGDYSEEDSEEMSCVATYAWCGRLGDLLDFECIRCDQPNMIPLIGEMFAFMRKETISPFDSKQTGHIIPYLRSSTTILPFPFPTRRVHILLSIQYALLGQVDLNVRCVNIEWTDQTIKAHFIIDGEITESNYQSMRAVNEELSQDFTNNTIKIEAMRCDYPQSLPHKGKITVYSRYEKREV